MNLLCPNCQKMLTVPEQFAGMLMKCPLCEKTFNVPGLPAPEPALSPAAPSAPADTYGLQKEAAAPVVTPPAPGSEPALPPEPLKAVSQHTAPLETPPAPASIPSAGYQKMYALYFSPRILQWVAAVAVVLIFILQFFPWVGVFPGGQALYQQNAWDAAFGLKPSIDDVVETSKIGDYKIGDLYPASVTEPGVSVLSIFYLLLFIPTLLITIACFVLSIVPLKVPTALLPVMPWRWGIAAALNIFVFLFLVLQLLIGFSLESTVETKVREPKAVREVEESMRPREKVIVEGVLIRTLHRRSWLELVVLLHLAAILGTFIVFRAGQNPNRPAPRLSLEW